VLSTCLPLAFPCFSLKLRQYLYSNRSLLSYCEVTSVQILGHDECGDAVLDVEGEAWLDTDKLAGCEPVSPVYQSPFYIEGERLAQTVLLDVVG